MKKRLNKKTKQTLLAALALTALSVSYLALRGLPEKNRNQPAAFNANLKTLIVKRLPANEIAKIELSGKEPLTIEQKADSSWTIANERLPLNQSALRQAANAFSSLSAQEEWEASEPLAYYGLDPAAFSATVYPKTEQPFTLFIGDALPSGLGYYGCFSGSNTIYALYSGALQSLNKTLADFIDPQMPHPDLAQTTYARIANRNGVIEIVPNNKPDTLSAYKMLSPYAEANVSADAFNEKILRLWGSRLPLNAWGYIPHPQSLSAYGLAPAQNPASFEARSANGEKIAVLIGKRNQENYAFYAKEAHKEPVWLLDDDLAASILEADAFALMDKFIVMANIKNVAAIILSHGSKSWVGQIKNYGADGTGALYFFNGFEVSERAFKEYYQQFLQVFYEGPALNARAASANVLDWAMAYQYHDGSQDTIEFYHLDADFYAVRLNGVIQPFKAGKYQLQAVLNKALLLQREDYQ